MFGVIVCPRCNRARGVNLSTSKTHCPTCGKGIDIGKAKVYFETDSESELAEAVRRMSEQLSSGLDSVPPRKRRRLGFYAELGRNAEGIKGEEERIRFIAEKLTERSGEFSNEELRRVLKGMREEDMTDILERALSSGIIYEPRPGRYRAT
ncbi:MAG: DUF1922 domain-containing protein [Euryarchaeota archaeon]|nr:DUF1922 domain-containing protein [Euryarchaeota archaeon]